VMRHANRRSRLGDDEAITSAPTAPA
jgi:hypothetical protein